MTVMAVLHDATMAHARRADPPVSFAHRLRLRSSVSTRRARFDPRDHFAPEDTASIRSKVDRMLAGARLLGHSFNPISLYWCHRPDGGLECVIAEVHHTYGGRHAYLLRPATARWLARLLLTRPFVPHRVSALIRRHGVRLWLRKAPLFPRTPQTAGGRLDG